MQLLQGVDPPGYSVGDLPLVLPAKVQASSSMHKRKTRHVQTTTHAHHEGALSLACTSMIACFHAA